MLLNTALSEKIGIQFLQVKTRKLCHTCAKPLSKTATVVMDQSQQMKMVSEKNSIQHQLNIVLNEKAGLMRENHRYKMIIDSMNFASPTMIDTKMINSLTDELAYISKLHIQKKIAAEITAAELKNLRMAHYHSTFRLECDVFANYNIEKYKGKLLNAVGTRCAEYVSRLIRLDGRSTRSSDKKQQENEKQQ